MRVQQRYEPAAVRWLFLAMVLALVLLIASVAAACPTCKEGLAQNDPQGQAIAAGYYYSILFMMAMPFAILGTFGSLAYMSIRRAQKTADHRTDPPEHSAETRRQ
jgi:heme/copper-type cytochrome/quinol oxidase subunit 2